MLGGRCSIFPHSLNRNRSKKMNRHGLKIYGNSGKSGVPLVAGPPVEKMSMSKAGIRAFIGFDLPVDVLDTMEDIQFDLLDYVDEPAIRLVKRETMHLTLRFLGDGIQAAVIPKICDSLDQLVAEIPPFRLEMTIIGCFPRPRNPRVIWVGIKDHTDRLQPLRRELDLALDQLDLSTEERSYKPHLTLAYVKDQKAVADSKLPWRTFVTPRKWDVPAVHLYHSQLTKQGPRYKKIHTANLSLT